ncbi:family 16 glycosylhydrolase [Paracoccus benzoatiresistens]|uniref:Family 16 glycosylhydrolase n=1 Tax=Paracoccus benzoatiresistens TaxID=2997341 RepID=A0ABT4J9D6_9RHOB|nr:family 16 glycosylhydrolase [Paracoccus sp. EF6]MCZ0963735.1 family 16 glycosylhydrolase [Paracoccus sp. EF6]
MQSTIVINGEIYVPTFADEFDTEEASFWRGYGSGGTWATSFSPHLEDTRTISRNGELQYYADPDMTHLPAAFTWGGGSLSIAASPLGVEQRAHAGGSGYSSGLLTTEMSFSVATGYIEIRADVPDEVGLWSAFWLLPVDDDWSAEIDVFEFPGENTSILHTNIWSDGQPDSLSIAVEDAGDGFHTYGLLWTADSIAWYYDGALVREEHVALTEEMYLILNLAVGGWAGDPDATTDFSDRLTVDYIRVYEREASTTRNPSLSEQPSSPDLGEIGSDAGDLMDGSRWADLIAAGDGNDTIYGDAGDDRLFGEAGDDQVFGHAGMDHLSGEGGKDKLIGGVDSDVLVGGGATDHLWGGNYRKDGSSDLFVFGRGCGVDYIHDFEPGLDRIDIASLPLTPENLLAGMKDEGWAVRVNLGPGPDLTPDAIYLVGLSSQDISRHDFELVPLV